MQAYLVSLFVASLVGALIGILSPDGGMSKHVRFVSALVLICVLISPMQEIGTFLNDLANGKLELPQEDGDIEDYRDRFESATNEASKSYFMQMLTETLEEQFSMPTGTVRCRVAWTESGETLSPSRVTVVLSGSSIWKNPHEVKDFVETLLGCECVTAIE